MSEAMETVQSKQQELHEQDNQDHDILSMPELQSGMKIDVFSEDNRFLFAGPLEVLSSDIIRVSMERGEALPEAAIDTPLKIRGALKNLDTFTLHGKIVGRRGTYWLIDCLTVLQNRNRRTHFRQTAISEAQFTPIGDTYDAAFGLTDPSLSFFNCKVIDVSLGGIRMTTDQQCHEGTRVLFKNVVLHNRMGAFSFPCRVVRAWEEDGEMQYGCQFEPLPLQERTHLLQAMFLIQREELHRSREEQ